ncbi:MAG: hypothetical protein RIQ81_1737 [Pseudomonadota bacterium]|jgi:hypothetical protein
MKNLLRLSFAVVLTFAVLINSSGARARTVEPAPDLDGWIKEVRAAPIAEQYIPARIQIVAGPVASAATDSLIQNGEEFRPMSPFTFIDRGTAQFSQKINSGDSAKKGAAAIVANLVFSDVKSSSAAVFYNDGIKLRKLGSVKSYSGDASPASLVQWTFQSLGYDGVILAVKGSYVLAGGPATILKGDKIQALAIRGSEKSMALLTNKRSGAGLLELEKSSDGYAIFRILALAKDAKELLVGTKLTIQKKN